MTAGSTTDEFLNDSGMGQEAQFPPQAGGLNWGAFFLNWIWGLGNNTNIALLCLIPVINVIMAFILLFKGNEWAWRNKHWRSLADFHRTQRVWAIVSLLMVTVPTIILGGFIAMILVTLQNVDAAKIALSSAQKDPEVQRALGTPLRVDGLVLGNVEVNNEDETASVTVPVRGPRANGTITFNGHRHASHWTSDRFDLVVSPSGRTLPLKL